MRRLAMISLMAALAIAAALAVTHGSSADGSSTARFDVIFDDARGLVAGQLVKIAGARAGTIDNVVVTPDDKARIEASVDARFMPFHRDASCTIRPEGLIAENYVDCDPGTVGSPTLATPPGRPPTVPVTNTTEPVSLLDLFNMFNLPTRERLTVLLDELGIGTAARGSDFNAILRRANPTLAVARQAIGILNRQRAQLAQIVSSTDVIVREAASHAGAVQQFLGRTAALTSLTAAHRGQLSLAVARLPGLLDAARPALQQLDSVAVQGTPLLAQLRAAAPSLDRVSADLAPLVKVAKPGLAKLSGSLRQATAAIRDSTPLVRSLRVYTDRSLPGTRLFAQLGSNLQRHGFVESFLSVLYYVGTSLARFDSTSHMLSLLLVGPNNGACNNYATTPVAGCSAHYGSQPSFGRARPHTTTRAPRATSRCAVTARSCARGVPERPRGPRQPSAATQPAPSSPQPSSPAPPASPASPAPGSPTNPIQQTTQTLQGLVQYLLK